MEIYEFLRKNGAPACKKTIWNDSHSDQAEGLAEELILKLEKLAGSFVNRLLV
jgi:hypothetical protein